MKFGLKIWSTNQDAFKRLSEFYDEGIIDYVELYTFPQSFDKKRLSLLLKIPVILHAPTFLHGMNLGNSYEIIDKLIDDVRRYPLFFKTNTIIFHPGVVVRSTQKSIENTIHNIRRLKNEFDMILENVPAIGIDGKTDMLAPDPDNFTKVAKETGVKTCLDFGHAVTAANYLKQDPFDFIRAFLKNRPYMYHLSDGDFDSHIDNHMDLTAGSFPLKKFIGMMPANATLSLETPKNDFAGLSEDLANLTVLRSLTKGQGNHHQKQ